MTNLVVKFFPLCAVLFSAFACVFPGTLNQLGFLIVPLLGFIMLGMGPFSIIWVSISVSVQSQARNMRLS